MSYPEQPPTIRELIHVSCCSSVFWGVVLEGLNRRFDDPSNRM